MSARLSALLIAATLLPLAPASAAPAHALLATGGYIVDVQYGGGGKYSRRHYSWCASRYRSYDPDTNSYWNSYGQRRQCRSPYM